MEEFKQKMSLTLNLAHSNYQQLIMEDKAIFDPTKKENKVAILEDFIGEMATRYDQHLLNSSISTTMIFSGQGKLKRNLWNSTRREEVLKEFDEMVVRTAEETRLRRLELARQRQDREDERRRNSMVVVDSQNYISTEDVFNDSGIADNHDEEEGGRSEEEGWSRERGGGKGGGGRGGRGGGRVGGRGRREGGGQGGPREGTGGAGQARQGGRREGL